MVIIIRLLMINLNRNIFLIPKLLFVFFLFRHVQVNNEGAIKFYEKHGFTIAEEKKNYYKRIEPADAYLLQKCFKESRIANTESAVVPS